MAVTVYQAPAGSGKTRQFAERIAITQTKGRIEVYVPTHSLANEWKQAILANNPLRRVKVVIGRDQPGPQAAPMCIRHTTAAKIIAAGQSVYPRLCHSGGPTAIASVCEHYDTCAYIGQFTGADVYIFTHAYLPLDRGMLDREMPAIVVIDESFFQTCLETIRLNIQALMDPKIPLVAQPLCNDIADAITKGLSLHNRFVLARARGGDLRPALASLRAAAIKPSPHLDDNTVANILAAGTNFEPFLKLIEHLDKALTRKTTPQSLDFDSASGSVVAHHRKDITRFTPRGAQKAPEIFVLDATADKAITDIIFPGAIHIRYDLQRNAQVIQCRSTRCSTSSLSPIPHANPKKVADSRRRLAELQKLIDDESANGQRVLVVGPTKVAGNPSKSMHPLVTVPSHCALAHFNAVRGVDGWKDFETVIVIGRNQPPANAVENIARALFFDAPVPLSLTGKWTLEDRGYRILGAGEGVDVEVHEDHRVTAILEQLRECETLQALDRIRLIHNTMTKKVILLSNIPLDIDVDHLVSWEELIHGDRFDRALAMSGGVLPLNPSWLTRHFPDLWATEGAAKKDGQRVFQKGHFSKRNTIGKMSLLNFQYRQLKQSRWSHCLSTLAGIPQVAASLSKFLGQSVKVRTPPP